MKSENNSHFIVTSFTKNHSKIIGSQVWDTSEPLTFGTPIEWVLEKTDTGVQVRPIHFSFGQADESKVSQYSFAELDTSSLISLSNVKLKLHPVRHLSSAELSDGQGWKPRSIIVDEVSQEEIEQNFKKTIGGALIGLLFFWLICFLWPKPKETEELIPAQFAKILLTPAFHGNTPTPQKQESSGARHEGLAQAMQSKAVKTTARKLVSSSRLALLAQSNILGGLSNQKVSRMFDSHTQANLSSQILAQNSQTSLNPSVLGGEKSANAKGDVGYGRGQKASLNSQGTATVSFDASEATVEEGLTLDEVGRVIHSHMKEIRYCYESSIVRDPSLEGKMIVNFKIQPNGRVRRGANAKESKMSDSGLERCILSRLELWKFPQPKGGVEVEVSYPFVFQVLQ